METIREELNEIFFDDSDFLHEMKLMDKNVIKKIQSKLVSAIKSKNAKTVSKLLKPVPSMSFDNIKTLLKKRVIKDKQKFDRNYKIADRSIRKIKNKDAKAGLTLATATLATLTDQDVNQIIEENKRVFDPKNLIMLLLGILWITKALLLTGGDVGVWADIVTSGTASGAFAGLIFAAAILMIIKSTYNLVAGKEAKHLFIII